MVLFFTLNDVLILSALTVRGGDCLIRMVWWFYFYSSTSVNCTATKVSVNKMLLLMVSEINNINVTAASMIHGRFTELLLDPGMVSNSRLLPASKPVPSPGGEVILATARVPSSPPPSILPTHGGCLA